MIITQPLRQGQAFGPILYRPPMLGNPGLGGIDLTALLGGVLEWLATGLGQLINNFATAIEIPLGILSQGVDFAFNGVASLVGLAPWVGPLLSEIILIGASIVKFGLSIPGLVLHGLGNLLEGWGAALDAKLTQREKEMELERQRKSIVDDAPAEIRDDVESLLDNSGLGSSDDILDDVTDALIGGGDPRDPYVPPVIDPPPEDEAPPEGEATALEKILPIAVPAVVGVLAIAFTLR